MKKSLLLNTFMVLFTAVLFAQAPQKICYQAAAKDAMGADLISQPISIRASVVKGSPGALPEWAETHSVVTDAFGLFTIDIGAGTFVNGNQTAFSDIEWGTGTFWLKIEMDATGGQVYQLMGTSQMLSVPYSLYANASSRAETAAMADVAMEVAGDNDLDDSNEIQTLSLQDGELTLLAPDGTPTGDPVDLVDALVAAGLDEDPTNEIQTLSFDNGELTLLAPDGTPTGDPVAITTPGGGGLDEDPTNELQTITYMNGTLSLLAPDGTTVGDPVQLITNGGAIDDSNTNEIQSLMSINGELALVNQDGNLTGSTVPFDESSTNELQTLGIQLGELVLLNADGTPNGAGIEFDVSNTNELQSLGIVNDTLVLLNSDGTVAPSSNGGGGIYLPEDNDLDDENELQELSYDGGILTLSGSNTAVNLMGGTGFDAPGSSSDFPQGIAGNHILETTGTFTVPNGKVFWITAGNSTMEITNVGPAPSIFHPTTPNMPVFGEGVTINNCMCTGMLVDTTAAIEPIILDFITDINTYQVPAGKVLFIKSGLKNDQPGRLRVNGVDMTFLSPSFTRGTRIMSFPEETDIQAIPNPFGEIDLILTGYLLDRNSIMLDPNN